MILPNLELTRVLFLDIETVSGQKDFSNLPEEWQYLWSLKAKQISRGTSSDLSPEEIASSYTEKAGIYSEFGKIVCLSVGILLRDSESKEYKVRLTSFKGDEKKLLADFSDLLQQYYPDPNLYFLCGHNLREFDVPFICRRILVHGLELPRLLQLAGKKPWETKYILDTLELWRFGDYKNYTSLKLLTALFDIPSPKDDIDGSEVGRVYWIENDLDRIATYCEKDVLAVVQLMLKYRGLPLLEGMDINHV